MSEREAGPEMYVKQGKYIPVVYVQGEPLSNEEREACAVLVACMRRGWAHLHNPAFGCVVLGKDGVPISPFGWTDTPPKAYAAALKATETEDEQ